MKELLTQLDLKHIWHPCTQMKEHETLPIVPIKRAKGIYLYDFDEKAYIDCISSWWVNLFGHCNDYINAAIKSQLDSLEHVLLAGFTHEPVVKLSQRLCDLLPPNLNKCFYADSGSAAVEIALKMSFHYFVNEGKPRKFFLSLSNSYHGETLGALSLGDIGLYKQTYRPLLIEGLQTPVPTSQHEDFSEKLDSLERILKNHGDEIFAFIIEPLLQCAGGMNMFSHEYVAKAVSLCRQYGIFIIFDEIAVGFGRTGSMFALEKCGVSPDLLCLSKGLSGGYLPLSVVVTTDSIYDAFYADYESGKAFLHSHSYTGNALACAAANASLDLFENGVIEKNKATSVYMAKAFERLLVFDSVKNLRICGMVVAFEISSPRYSRLFMFQEGLKLGLLLRPLGTTIYFMPPYVVTNEEIDSVVAKLEAILGRL